MVSDGSKPCRNAIQTIPATPPVPLDRLHVVRLVRTLDGCSPPADSTHWRSWRPTRLRTRNLSLRYLQLTRFDQVSEHRIQALCQVLSGRPELKAAWQMFQHLYGSHVATDDEEANQAPGAFIEFWEQTLLEFDKLVGTLVEWGEEINFQVADRVTNGQIEGSINTAGVLKRVAYGFSPMGTTSPPVASSSPQAWQHEKAE